MIWAAIFLLSLYWDTFPQAGLRTAIFQRRYEAQSLLTIIKCHATVFAKEGVSLLLTRKPAITFSKYKRAMDETISSCPASAQDRSVFWELSPLGWLDTHFAGLLCILSHWGKQSPVLKCKTSLSSLTLLEGQKRQQWLRDDDTYPKPPVEGNTPLKTLFCPLLCQTSPSKSYFLSQFLKATQILYLITMFFYF